MFHWFKQLLARPRSSGRPRPTVRPWLEALENRTVPSIAFMAAEFQGTGVWLHTDAATSQFSTAGWHQLTTADASLVAVDDLYGSVVAEFQGQGVWRFNENSVIGTGWKQLTTVDATSISINYNSGVAAEFQGQGVWRYADYKGNGLQGWQRITGVDAKQVVSYDSAGDIAANFGGGGLWIYKTASSQWTELTTASASTIDASYGEIAAVFPGQGVWRYNLERANFALGWKQLTTADATSVGVDSYGDVAAEFQGTGVWHYGETGGIGPLGWKQLTTFDAGQVDMGGFGAVGAYFTVDATLWQWTGGGGWTKIDTFQPLVIDVGD